MGNHYTPAESEEAAAKGQADPIIDRTYPGIEQLKSLLTSRPPKWKVIGREWSDFKMAKVRDARLQYIWDISEGAVEFKEAVHAYAATWGKGYLFVELDPLRDYGNGEVIFNWVDTSRVYVPVGTRKRFEDDAAYKILSTVLTGEMVANMFPEGSTYIDDGQIRPLNISIDQLTGEITGDLENIDSYSDDDYPSSSQQNTVSSYTPPDIKDRDSTQLNYHLLQRFFYVQVPFYRVKSTREIDQAPAGTEAIMNEGEFQAFTAQNENLINTGAFVVTKVNQRRVRHVMTLGQILIADEVLNTDIYPLIAIPNIWTGTPYTLSDISKIKDVQILLNKLWSVILQHAQKSAKPWLLVPEGSMDVSKYEEGEEVTEYNHEFGEPHFAAPAPLASAFFGLLDKLSFYIDFILGIPELLQGFKEGAPETLGQTKLLSEFAQGRPKSKLQDIEGAISRLGRVCDNYANTHYTPEKTLRIIQANNDTIGIVQGFYPDWTPTVEEIERDKKIGQYDFRVEAGSMLPSDPWAEYALYRQAYIDGLAPRSFVLKRNPDIFDAREILEEFNEIAQRDQAIAQLQEQLKKVGGDLQTAQRESVQDKKRVEVQKFAAQVKGALAEIKARGNKEVGQIVNRLEKAIDLLELERKELSMRGKESPRE